MLERDILSLKGEGSLELEDKHKEDGRSEVVVGGKVGGRRGHRGGGRLGERKGEWRGKRTLLLWGLEPFHKRSPKKRLLKKKACFLGRPLEGIRIRKNKTLNGMSAGCICVKRDRWGRGDLYNYHTQGGDMLVGSRQGRGATPQNLCGRLRTVNGEETTFGNRALGKKVDITGGETAPIKKLILDY